MLELSVRVLLWQGLPERGVANTQVGVQSAAENCAQNITGCCAFARQTNTEVKQGRFERAVLLYRS